MDAENVSAIKYLLNNFYFFFKVFIHSKQSKQIIVTSTAPQAELLTFICNVQLHHMT